jgi:hypothetical protein
MTRDEAIQVVWKKFQREPPYSNMTVKPEWLANYVDSWIELGMLKVDEPVSMLQRMISACYKRGISGGTINMVVDALEEAGLKVIEK